MKKTLIIAALACVVLGACSSETKQETTTDSPAVETTATADTTMSNVDTSSVAKDSLAVDSATKAHGHSH
ncbi:hypothetical protein [Pedobacter nanyangensis]|uniref:hypothetical protein n=1 Tax=Pedobacter nanyangensis TaxID=1562389 RepID=UPI000DE40689|nr:hypothetical protein [Pedobacter nanyangensis]